MDRLSSDLPVVLICRSVDTCPQKTHSVIFDAESASDKRREGGSALIGSSEWPAGLKDRLWFVQPQTADRFGAGASTSHHDDLAAGRRDARQGLNVRTMRRDQQVSASRPFGDQRTGARGERLALIADHPDDQVAAYQQLGQSYLETNEVEEATRALRTGVEKARARGDWHASAEMEGLLANLGGI